MQFAGGTWCVFMVHVGNVVLACAWPSGGGAWLDDIIKYHNIKLIIDNIFFTYCPALRCMCSDKMTCGAHVGYTSLNPAYNIF